MSATIALSQLKGLLEKTKQLKEKFSKVYPTNEQWGTLSNLSLELSEAAKLLENEIRELKESRTERAWRESEEHRLKAQSTRGDLFAKGRLKQPVIFRRNIITIFEGPKDSKFDSEDQKFRKESTRKRCESIRRLSPDGVISWAMAFPPTVWAGGSMASDVFTCLLDDMEPELVQAWPKVIRDTLDLLMEDEESLKLSLEYGEFLKAIDDPLRKPLQRKRRRVENNEEEKPAVSAPLYNERREIKYMCTNALASDISTMPEPFRTYLQNSRLWKWERSQEPELKTTGCLSTLFPESNEHDVTVTLFVGHEDGYSLNDVYGLQLATAP